MFNSILEKAYVSVLLETIKSSTNVSFTWGHKEFGEELARFVAETDEGDELLFLTPSLIEGVSSYEYAHSLILMAFEKALDWVHSLGNSKVYIHEVDMDFVINAVSGETKIQMFFDTRLSATTFLRKWEESKK